MPPNQGLFIVLEGADGSGKGTQFKLLRERLAAAGYEVEVFDFPRYDQPSSHFVKQYLNGGYGPAGDISPYTASLFYALDRYEAAADVRRALESGKIVLSNRYAGSNMAHQGSKFTNSAEQRGFFVWADSLEYQLLGIPRPSLNIFLRVPAEVSYELIANKAARDYTERKRDEHEADKEHLKRTIATYDLLCQLFPKDFAAIDCVQDEKLLPIPAISDKVWELLKKVLPPPKGPGQNRVVHLDESKDVPAKKEKPVPQAAKSAAITLTFNRLSLLAATSLSQFGSVQIDDIADTDNGLRDLLNLKQDLISKLSQSAGLKIDQVEIARISLLLSPLGSKCNVRLMTSEDLLKKLGANLSLFSKEDSRLLGSQLPESIDAAGANNRPEAIQKLLSELSVDHLPKTLTADTEPVELSEALPKNEFDLLTKLLYPVSDGGHDSLAQILDGWTYEQKQTALQKAAQDIPKSVLPQISYKFDILSDRLRIYELANTGLITELSWQMPSARYGYAVPEVIEQAGLEDEYLYCFDKSLELYSQMQQMNHKDSWRACLMGHKNRAQVTVTAESLQQLLVKKDLPRSVAEIIASMAEAVRERHSIIGEVIAAQPAKLPKNKNRRRRNRSVQQNKQSAN